MSTKPTFYKKKWPAKNLGELIHFLETQHSEGLSIKSISKKTGMTQQNISYLFNKDDMKLSKAESVVQAYGCTLKLFFPQRIWKFQITGLTRNKPRREFPNAKNLSGLVKYMNDSNKTINSMCKDMGINNSVLTSAFNNGDIYISTLYDVAEHLGIEFVWSFEPNKNN